jgi:hypothetical protein
MDFQIYYVISKEQAKTEFDFFHQLRNKKIKKISAHVQKVLVPGLLYKPSKKYSSRDTIHLTTKQGLWRLANKKGGSGHWAGGQQ